MLIGRKKYGCDGGGECVMGKVSVMVGGCVCDGDRMWV